ncbi:molybdopterin converting factor subunit 1 [Bacillus sp. FJAT-49736]|uniref:molybdopterin converting factor subunit 1 n=1 Tax=Bacillus sp. FJAT-49736 TaxID=2833582 RepID=UPI001BC93814|nr:molybdopterin converting factor subunit 1 [Bacillus sp. FJAT-49736]MBS4175363.1 molybdopterin converting factor subunit 1 [Bacillus sp. FJAT-49736]
MNKILLFAQLRDQVGKQELYLDFKGKTVKELKKIMQESYSFNDLDSVMIAINEEFVSEEEIIQEGDTIAFIPPVSGG